MGLKACKFGGTSLADANGVRRVAEIVAREPARRYVVVSAPGKREPSDHKVTDLLLASHSLARQGLDFTQPLGMVRDRFRSLAADLGVRLDVRPLLDELEAQVRTEGNRDLIASRGEYLCARIVADFLGARFVDARRAIGVARGRSQVTPDTYPRLRMLLEGEGPVVVPGFYGSDTHGDIVTFPRGGSDITGSVVARAVGAEVYENWTDVPGLLMTDPAVVPEAQPILEVTYRELRELSYMGAKVLHEEATFPVREAGIPIHIRSTWEPDAPGTRVLPSREHGTAPVVGIAGRTGCSTIHIEKAMMNEGRGFGRRVLDILEFHGISWLHAPTGIDTMSVVVWDEELEGKGDAYLADIERILEPDRLELIGDLALLATVGQGMANTVGIAGRLFTSLADAGVNIRMIDQGSSEISIIVAVAAADYSKAVRAIYDAFAGPCRSRA
ncbi:MAG TPA: aspartate kinase [Armatimonadota bacterium]|nr:aspartate kinase [Armatimonadota bacterium]